MKQTATIETITPENHSQSAVSPEMITDFLHDHLDRFRDPKNQIMQCLNYALGKNEGRRGFVMVAREGDSGRSNSPGLLHDVPGSFTEQPATGVPASDPSKIRGVVVVCETGMSGFVPENLLVYIAVDQKARGRGIGKTLMENAIKTARGDIALHVEPDNPARRLYERIGFTSKYLEMRLSK